MYLRSVVVLGSICLVACASTPKRGATDGPKGGAAATCARIAKETRAAVVAARAGASDEVSVDAIVSAIEPYGKCSEAVPGGHWAFVVRADDLSFTPFEPLEMDGHSMPLPALGVTASARPVFVADGGSVSAPAEISLPSVDVLLDAQGNWTSSPFPGGDPETVVLDLTTDWSGDGVPEAIVTGGVVVALQRAGKNVVAYELSTNLTTVTGTLDFDGDKRPDLADSEIFAVHLQGDGNYARGFPLVAHALASGGFATDDAATRAYYEKTCDGLGASPWLVGRGEDEAVGNIECARLYGVPAGTIERGMDAEVAAQPEDLDGESSAGAILPWNADAIREATAIELPFLVGRADGRRVLTAARATASSSEPVWQGYHFEADLAIDGDRGTSWQPKKSDKSPTLTLAFTAPVTITALEVANGLQRKDALGDLFLMNRRVTKLRVTAGTTTLELALDPTARGYQTLVLPAPLTTDKLALTILASVDGTRWKSLALSDVRALTGP